MTITISNSSNSVQPNLVLGYAVSRKSANMIHTIIGRSDPDVTLKPAGLRTGKLEFFFLTLADALTADTIHKAEGTVALADTDLPALNMSYVTSGDIELELDDDTRKRWIVRVDFQEVLP